MRDQRLSGSTASVHNARCDLWLGSSLKFVQLAANGYYSTGAEACDSLLPAVTIKGAGVSASSHSGNERCPR